MESIYKLVDLYIIEIILLTFILALLAIAIVILNFQRTSKMLKKYNKMMRGMNNKNLEYMLFDHLKTLEKVDGRVSELDKNVQIVLQQLKNCLQKPAIIRYNPFDQMGSDQSFSVALLDKDGHGVVLTGLYARESSSIFAKPINDYKSSYPLSNEEKHVIELARDNAV